MKMTFFAAAMAAVGMLACTKPSPEEGAPESNREIRFGQSVEAYSKAPVTGTSLTSGEVKLYGLEYSTAEEWKAANFMDGVVMIVNGGGLDFKVAGTKYYYSNTAGTKYKFYAYYPADDAKITAAAGADNIPVVTFDCAGQSDLMWARSAEVTKSNTPVALVFTHRLAQVIVKIQLDADYAPAETLSVTAASVNAQSTGTMKLSDGSVSLTGTAAEFTVPGTISLSLDKDNKGPVQVGDAFMLPEQSLSSMKVTIGGEVKTVNFASGVTLTPGRKTEITLTVKGQDVSFGQTVTDWTDGSTGSGDVEM